MMDEAKVLNSNISEIAEAKELKNYKLIVEMVQDAVFIKDLESRYIFVNQKMLEVLGNLPRQRVIGKNDYEFLPPDQAKAHIENDQKVFKTGNSMQITEKISMGDKKQYFDKIKVPLKDDRGKIVGLIGIVREITEGKKAEDALQQSEQKYYQLIEDLHEGIWYINKDGYITFVNYRMAEMLGYTVDEIQGKHLFSFMDEKGVEMCKHHLERCKKGFKSRDDFEFLKKDGICIYTAMGISPIVDNGGNYLGAIASVTDISDRKKAEEELRQEKQKAEELLTQLESTYEKLEAAQNQLLRREKIATTGTLAAGVAHEIRNPLAIIGMTVQYLQSNLSEKDPKRELTEAIIRKVERLDRVTKELSSYGRTINLNIRKHNLNRCLNSNLALIKSKCRIQKIKIKKRYSKLPLIEIDDEQMDKVFFNIMDNAVHAMPKGGVVTVSTEVNEGENKVIVRIHNTGHVIKKKHVFHIFEPFYTLNKKNDGTGLGLAITQSAVIRHNGQISVENKSSGENKGVTFIIRLPLTLPKVDRSDFPAKGEVSFTSR